jgi:adenosylcobyric acid synthase
LTDDRHCPGARGQKIEGYEIHMGLSRQEQTWLTVTQRSGEAVSVADGGVSQDGRVWGCYVHGLFANVAFRRAWLDSLTIPDAAQSASESSLGGQTSAAETLDDALDDLADRVESALDMERLQQVVWAEREVRSCLKI